MIERTIENKVKKYAKDNGWWVRKFVSPAHSGSPDDIFIKNGKVLFIEFKATGEKPRKLQVEIIKQMTDHGATVHVVDSIEQGKGVLDNAFN